MIKRFVAPACVLLLGFALGSCTQFAGTVSDAWPTWAGGMPKDVPPRPGSPGYDAFMLQQQGKDQTTSSVPAAPAGQAGAPQPAVQQTAAPSTPSAYGPPDQPAVKGGLY
jgi:hypothetical protein